MPNMLVFASINIFISQDPILLMRIRLTPILENIYLSQSLLKIEWLPHFTVLCPICNLFCHIYYIHMVGLSFVRII